MNIFETIEKVTSGIEQYHSQFLVDALADSLNGDRSLFDSVWRLAAPPGWEVPEHAEVRPEEQVERGAVDICIRTDSPNALVIGIEVKTLDASATHGQLEKYHDGLVNNYPGAAIQITYLTPFNRKRAGEMAGSRRTIQAFDQFSKGFPQARHISWLDIAEIPWDGNFLWKQHQAYVTQHISAQSKLQVNTESNRSLDVFFGGAATQNFWEELALWGIFAGEKGATIDFSAFKESLPSLAASLVRAFEVLLDSDVVSRNSKRTDRFAEEFRRPFLDSEYREVHAALYGLADLHSFLWVEGEENYAIRAAHKNHSSGVSLFRSYRPHRIVVGEPR